MTARVSRMLPFLLAMGIGATGSGLGCKAKPSEKACKEAIENIRRISGQDANDVGADPVAAIRSCRGNSSKEAVECMRVAKTLKDLEKCEAEAGGLAAPAAPPAKTETPKEEEAAVAVPKEEPPAAPPAKGEAAADTAPTATSDGGMAAPAKTEPAVDETAKTEPAVDETAKTEPAVDKTAPASP